MMHDYKRHGTTTLLNILDGTVVGRCMQRHRPVVASFNSPFPDFYLSTRHRDAAPGRLFGHARDDASPR